MNTRIIMACAAALSLLATPAMAQTKAKAPTRRPAAVAVNTTPAKFKAARTRLGTSSESSLQAILTAKAAKDSALGSKIDVVYIKLGDIDGYRQTLKGALKGAPKSGKSKTASGIVAKIDARSRSARSHVTAAKKAYGKKNVAAARRALAAAEVEIRAIGALSSKLGLLEPVVHR